MQHSGADEQGTDDTMAGLAVDFDTVRRGYRPEQVATVVRELQWRLEMAERGQHEAQERAASLTAALDAASSTAPDTFGMRAEKVLRMAEHDAAQRRERAEADAGRIVDVAHDEAERLIAAARVEAERTRADADAAVARVHDDAAAARRDTDLCADTAAAMHEHVLGLRSAVRGEVARLHAAMGAELRALDEMIASPPVSVGADPDPGPGVVQSEGQAAAPAATTGPEAAPVATPATSPVTGTAPPPAPTPAAAPAAASVSPPAGSVALPEQRPQPSRETREARADAAAEPAAV
ncbi:MAG: DivIVA domain-containing protein [Pseudonocardia sp.]|nr:DivIVA domain-containing protein [Pseudonocardia sp.]